MASLGKKIKNIMIVIKSDRFDRMAGLNRVIGQIQKAEKNDSEPLTSADEALMNNEKIMNMRKEN